MAFVPWSTAMHAALYGESGFYRRPEGPAGHFRTSVHASPRFAHALGRLATGLHAALGFPAPFDLVDVGAGRGELLAPLARTAPPRWRLIAVEIAARPDGLPARVEWRAEVPDGVVGLIVANEWLDNVPVDVVEQTEDGPRLVLVDEGGVEAIGPVPAREDLDWLERWWPLGVPGDRAEVGRGRDAAWAGAVGRLHRGLAVAIDYAHERGSRPAYGTLTGHRGGVAVPPVPDGSCDLTAHVALDACAAAASTVADEALLTTQRKALRALGVTAARPPRELARTDPAGYLMALSATGEVAELTDPAGLGSFGWLVQAVGTGIPGALRAR